ncbi:MAG: hypothetical protein ACPL68_07620, partial [Candidatus Hydrothermia bacterium]
MDSLGMLEWAKTLGGTAEDVLFGVVQGADGTYWLAGRTRSYGVGNIDMIAINIAPDGSLLRVKTYGEDLLELCWDICPIIGGGIAFAGGTNSFGSYKILISRVEDNGSLSWAKVISVENVDDGAEAYSIINTADSGFAITGIGVTTDYLTDSMDVVFIKTDSSGNVEWARTLRGNKYDWGISVIQTTDRGFVVVGSTASSGVGGSDILVFKMNSLGSLEWAKTYGNGLEDMGYSIAQTPDNSYIVSARVDDDDFGILKVSPDGSMQWAKKIHGSSWEAARNIIPTSDGCYIFVGEAGSFGGAGAYDAAAVKFSHDGYPGCFEDWSAVESDAGLTFEPINMTSAPVSLISTTPSGSLGSRTMTTRDICAPSVEEQTAFNPSGIICYCSQRGLSFISTLECPI